MPGGGCRGFHGQGFDFVVRGMSLAEARTLDPNSASRNSALQCQGGADQINSAPAVGLGCWAKPTAPTVDPGGHRMLVCYAFQALRRDHRQRCADDVAMPP